MSAHNCDGWDSCPNPAHREQPTIPTPAWVCELHRISTTTDCPKCDAEQIAALEQYAKTPACHLCQRTLRIGEAAWASDWIVIEADGTRHETRYTCDDCDAFA